MIRRTNTTNRGSILILSLWTLTFLSLFAFHVGLTIRQRATLLSRIENRSQLRFIANAGIKKSLAILKNDIKANPHYMTSSSKFTRHNDESKFRGIKVGRGIYDVFYTQRADGFFDTNQIYGIVDEERKINLNVSDRTTLKNLIQYVAGVNEDRALNLADAIIDWTFVGQSQLTGFYSDDYYSNLQYPYKTKDAQFELIDELLLLSGVDQKIFDRLKDYVTVYGDGYVNINTASREVLLALGLDDIVVDKILVVRRGEDGLDNTSDDFVFLRPYDIASDVKRFVDLKLDEYRQIDLLNSRKIVKTNSVYFSVKSKAMLPGKQEEVTLECVYNALENRIEYWREKF